jgi:hypothetical protein
LIKNYDIKIMNYYKFICNTEAHTIKETKKKGHTIILKLLHPKIKLKQYGTFDNL